MSDSILKRLLVSRVFGIEPRADGTFRVEEHCDLYFYEDLTRDEMMRLSREIAELAEKDS